MEVRVIYVCTVLVSGDSRLLVCSLERNVQVNFFPLSASPPRGIYRHSNSALLPAQGVFQLGGHLRLQCAHQDDQPL